MPLIRFEHRHSTTPMETRHFKGGDGGAGAMREQEEERQRRVQAAVDIINSKFNGSGRESMYKEVADATRDVAMRDVDQQFTQASNQNLFGLARAGLLGGSVDAESGADLARRYGEGGIRATAAGQNAGAELRSVDERTRANLVSLAQSGLDTGTAATMAAGQIAAATDAARSATAGASVGRLFDDMGQAYLQNQVLRARTPAAPASGSSPTQYSSNLFSGANYGGTVRR